jgi:hypothetical protein
MKTLRAGAFLWLAACVSISLSISGCGDAKYVRRTADDPDKQEQLNWNYQTTVDVYQKSHYKSFRWNTHAVTALAEFSCYKTGVFTNNEPCAKIIGDNAAAAVHSGCQDPMVIYLYIKFAMSQTNSPQAFTDAFYQTAIAMANSPYPDVRKFYSGFRTIQQFIYAEKNPSDWNQDMDSLSKQTEDNLFNMLNDSHTPREEVYDACSEYLNLWSGSKERYPKLWARMEPLVFQSWSDDETMWLLKAGVCVKLGWFARGNGYANTVTQDGERDFEKNLAGAEDAVNHAWKINPQDVRIPQQMMDVLLGQGGERDRMETWFNRGMQLDPNNYQICTSKLYYLEPKWYGSREDMLAFGRECVTNANWGGNVPLILADAHWNYCRGYIDKSVQDNYWKQPDVWPDIKAAYDRFFQLNPDEVGHHHNYAWYAYTCGQWNEFLHQTTLFSAGTNYDYFGGKKSFDDMMETARENSGK